jgi:hypothetical protein
MRNRRIVISVVLKDATARSMIDDYLRNLSSAVAPPSVPLP